MAVQKICEREIGGIMYKLVFFDGDNKYVIYKCDKEKMRNEMSRLPEVAEFDNEDDARKFLEKLV